jgi:hypothetical protein
VACALLCVPNLYGWGKSVHSIFCKLRKTQGTVAAQNLFKAAEWQAKKSFLGDPLPKEEIMRARVPTDRYGLPTYLPLDLRQTLRAEPGRLDRAVALFLLSLYRLYNGKRPLRLENITRPGDSIPEVEREYRRLVPALLLMLGVTEPLQLGRAKLFATNRGGPNGHALLTAHLDAVALEGSKDTGQWFHKWVREIYPREGYELSFRVTRLAELTRALGLVPVTKLYLGKVGVKPEPTKNRIFAISDYWTQVALRPLHDALMAILRALDTDSTWNQDKGAVDVQRWSAEGRELWSFDLTAATDRFPRTLQASLLDHLLRGYGSGYGQVWSSLLTNRGYKTPGHSGREVRYAVGQPMGTLSSWAAFALTHHTVVQWAALRSGRQTFFKDYRLLGDDIVIADGAVAASYEVLMSQLGVGINRSKSVHAVGSAEFAKRSFAEGTELTGLHWNLFGLASNSMVHFYTNCAELKRRGFDVDWTGVLMVVLGKTGDRKVSRPVRSLLLALAELAGPLEDPSVWWAMRWARSSKEFFAALAEPAIDNRILKAALHCLGLKSLKAERQLLQGRVIQEALAGQLETILTAQLEDAMIRAVVPTLGLPIGMEARDVARAQVRLIPDLRARLEKLFPFHPGMEVSGATEKYVPWTPDPTDLDEFLLNRRALKLAPEQLRLLSRSDSEVLSTTRDIIGHANDRLQACLMRWSMGHFEE